METAEKIIQWRRELHRHPEEGWTEFWTTGFVARQLADMGLGPRVGQEVIDPAARMGLPAPEVEARARQRALAEGLEPYWLERMGALGSQYALIPHDGSALSQADESAPAQTVS